MYLNPQGMPDWCIDRLTLPLETSHSRIDAAERRKKRSEETSDESGGEERVTEQGMVRGNVGPTGSVEGDGGGHHDGSADGNGGDADADADGQGNERSDAAVASTSRYRKYRLLRLQ